MLDREQKERGFSAPLSERKNLTAKERIYIGLHHRQRAGPTPVGAFRGNIGLLTPAVGSRLPSLLSLFAFIIQLVSTACADPTGHAGVYDVRSFCRFAVGAVCDYV